MQKDGLKDSINEKFKECVKEFHKQMNAHLNTYPLIMSVLVAKFKYSCKIRDEYVEKNDIQVFNKDNSQMFEIPIKHHQAFQELQNDVEYSM